MTNLLPRERRKRVERERWIRMIAIGFILLFTVVILSMLALAPSLLLSRSKGEDANRQLGLAQEFVARQEESGVAEEIRITRENLNTLDVERRELVLTEILNTLAQNTHGSVRIENIRFNLIDNTTGSITINGFAATRDNLLSFIDRLEGEPLFSEIDLPVSNLAQSTNVRFLFTTHVGQKEQ